MDNLPDDLLTEILVRLPAEALIKLKTTNTRWYHLISKPEFIVNHARRSSQYVLGLFHSRRRLFDATTKYSYNRVAYFSLDSEKALEHPNIRLSKWGDRLSFIDSHRGFFLVFVTGSPEHFYLCNPISKLNLSVASLDWPIGSTQFGLVVNLEEAYNNVALQYMIACVHLSEIQKLKGSETFVFKIYSSDSDRWRVSNEIISCVSSRFVPTFGPVYSNGALHWLREDGSVIAFDMEKERARMMGLPVTMSMIGTYSNVLLTATETSMNLIRVLGGEIELWSLEDYGREIWRLKWSGACEHDRGSECRVVPIFYNNARQIVLGLCCRDSPVTFFTYDIKNGSWKEVGRLKPWMDQCKSFYPYSSNIVG